VLLLLFILYLLVNLDSSKISYLAFNFFVVKEPGKVYRHIIRYKSWPKIERFKKHKALAHCKDVANSIVHSDKPGKELVVFTKSRFYRSDYLATMVLVSI
jgi:hypothetical protein